jgi:hypothetical protein
MADEARRVEAVRDLVPSVSIETLLERRDALVQRLRAMVALLGEMKQLSQIAFGSDDGVPSLQCQYTHSYLDSHGVEAMIVRVDAVAWQYLMDESGLRTFMNAEARNKWDKTLHEAHASGRWTREEDKMPPLTLENIRATFEGLYAQRGDMFEDGVVSVFKALSWDYQTNNPYKLGRRIILEHVLDTWNNGGKRYTTGPSHTGSGRLDDLLRVMMVLDGKPEVDHRQGAYHVLGESFGYSKSKTGVAIDLHGMLTIKCFKNGNGHITFLRPDLVDKLNEIIERRHPGALPPKHKDRRRT